MKSKFTRRDFLKYGVRGLVVAGIGKGNFNTWSGQVELTRVPLKIKSLPAPFHGFKIGLLTDLHSSLIVSRKLIAAAAGLIMAEQPDLIVLTGDYISGATKFLSGEVGAFKEEYLSRCVDALSGLQAPLGIFGVLGNHDFWSGPEAVRMICNAFSGRLGLLWLRNSNIEIRKDGRKLYLLGVDDYWQSSCSLSSAMNGLDQDSVRILLSHNPDINADISMMRQRIDLVLSGHTHGGQVVAPFIGQPIIPSKFGQKYRSGLVFDSDRQTYVSRGVGHLIAPIRMNCSPEATIVTLACV